MRINGATRVKQLIVRIEQHDNPNDNEEHHINGVLHQEELSDLNADSRADQAAVGEDDGVEAEQHVD